MTDREIYNMAVVIRDNVTNVLQHAIKAQQTVSEEINRIRRGVVQMDIVLDAMKETTNAARMAVTEAEERVSRAAINVIDHKVWETE